MFRKWQDASRFWKKCQQDAENVRNIISGKTTYAETEVIKDPNVAAEIEKVIRDQANAISKELEGNPSPNEKISEEKEDK